MEETYKPYVVISRFGDRPHKGQIMESELLSSVQPPPITYTHDIPENFLQSKDHSLSGVQMDAVLSAGQAHLEHNDHGRQAFVLGKEKVQS